MPKVSTQLADQSSFASHDTLRVGSFATPLAADDCRCDYLPSRKAAGAIAEAAQATSGGCAVPSGYSAMPRWLHFPP
jgi:hypothetical protein